MPVGINKINIFISNNMMNLSSAVINTKLKFMENEKRVLEEMCGGKRDSRNSVDGEMCHLLSADTEKLKTENKVLKDKADAKESEVRKLKRQLREIEANKTNMESQMNDIKALDDKKKNMLNSEIWQDRVVSDLTPKSALKKMVEELNDECGK